MHWGPGPTLPAAREAALSVDIRLHREPGLCAVNCNFALTWCGTQKDLNSLCFFYNLPGVALKWPILWGSSAPLTFDTQQCGPKKWEWQPGILYIKKEKTIFMWESLMKWRVGKLLHYPLAHYHIHDLAPSCGWQTAKLKNYGMSLFPCSFNGKVKYEIDLSFMVLLVGFELLKITHKSLN